MEIKKDTVDGLKHTYQVSVAPEAIEMRVKSRILEAGKGAKIPGFRPGKAPLQILQQRYESNVRPEVIRALIDESYRKLLVEKKLRPAGQPQITVDSYDVNKALECTYEFEVLPEIQEIDLKKKVKLEKLTSDVEQKMVKDSLDRIAATNKTTEPLKKERAAQKGDTVFIDFEGRTKDGPISGGSGKGVSLELGSGYFIPGFEEQIEGMKKGQNKKIEVPFPEDYSAADLAGKDATFDCTLQDIHTSIVPKIDDAFCEKMGFKTLKELEDAIKAQLVAENERMSFLVAKKDVLDALDSEKIDLPKSLVENEVRQITLPERSSEDLGDEGDKKAPKKSKKETDEEKKMHKIAERRVRLGLILADIGNKNNVEVTNKELQQAIIDQARRYPGEEQKVMEYFQKNKEAQQSLRAPIFEDKVIALILSKADMKEKKVSQEVLEKAVKAVTEAEI
ncbi:MAG: trigger factor [Alphaproteobacteria bacterium]|nr:trigger factor [Alphaproteobacteria bacterium]NCQ66485.1 trigger factor [Alphaproteobacteria bacterium]